MSIKDSAEAAQAFARSVLLNLGAIRECDCGFVPGPLDDLKEVYAQANQKITRGSIVLPEGLTRQALYQDMKAAFDAAHYKCGCYPDSET